MFTRTKTKLIQIGSVRIGHANRVVIQSMTNTKTSDIKSTVDQINKLVDQGCELVRVAILDQSDLQALPTIIKKSICPIIADIHYNTEFAIGAILAGASKIRINPGNISNLNDLKKIVITAKEHDAAIRLGFNSGSWSKATSMVQQAKKYIKLFESWGFTKIVVSFKSSDPFETTKAYLEAAKSIKYPLHLGVTESGSKDSAIIKTTIGLAPVLQAGVGDTIRVSISGSPIQEPIIAKKLLANFGLYKNIVDIVSCPTCGRLQWDFNKLLLQVEAYTTHIKKPIHLAIMGCSVNGIGECKKADIGVFGNKTHNIIYKKGKPYKTVKHNITFNELKKLLDNFK